MHCREKESTSPSLGVCRLLQELADLKEKPRLFQICDTGSRVRRCVPDDSATLTFTSPTKSAHSQCISFVSCKELDPLQLVQGMYEMVVRNKEANTRLECGVGREEGGRFWRGS